MIKEDFSLKKDMLQIQKKVTDLELTATELKEVLAKFDTTAIDDLKQRVGDIEDLTMVENAAVLELKKMLEGSQPAQREEPNKLEELTSKVTELEDKISNAQPDATQINEIKTNLENLKVEIESKISDVRTTVPNIDLVTNEIRREVDRSVDWLKSEVNSLLEERTTSIEKQVAGMGEKLSKIPSPEELISIVDGMSSSFKSFRATIESRFQAEENKLEERWSHLESKFSLLTDLSKTIEEFKADAEMKKEGLDNMIGSLEQKLRMPLPERAVRELEKIRNDWIVNNARMDAMESLVKNIERQIGDLRPVLKKLDTFDRILDLHKEITQKLEEMKHYSESAKILAEKAETIDLSKIEKHVEKKIRDEINKAKDRMERNILELQDDMSVLQGTLMPIEKNNSGVMASVAELQEKKAELEKRLGFNENVIYSMSKELITVKNILINTDKTQSKNEMPELIKKVYSLEAEIENIKSLKPEDTTNELVNKINQLETKIDSIRTYAGLDEGISELVNRIVFLESRIVAMEGMIQDMPRYSPIIVE